MVLCVIAYIAVLVLFAFYLKKHPHFLDYFVGMDVNPTTPKRPPKESVPDNEAALRALRFQQDMLRLDLCALDAQEKILLAMCQQQAKTRQNGQENMQIWE